MLNLEVVGHHSSLGYKSKVAMTVQEGPEGSVVEMRGQGTGQEANIFLQIHSRLQGSGN